MNISRSVLQASLRRHAGFLQDAVHKQILDGLQADGLCSGGSVNAASASKLSRIEAALADPDRAPAARYGLGELRRLGVKLEASGDVDIDKLNEAMTCAKMSVERRIGCKQALHRAGILD